MKSRRQKEVMMGRPLGIDFSSILVGLGRQVGRENRAKSEQKAIQKCIEKMMEKSMHFGGPWGGVPRAWLGNAGNLGPPN